MFYFGRGMKQMFLIFNFVVFFKKNILLTWFGKHAWKKRKKNFYRNSPGVIYIQFEKNYSFI